MASAQSYSYMGVGAGGASHNTGIDYTTGSAEIDEDDGFGRFIVGANLNDFVAFEFTMANLGRSYLTGNSGDWYGYEDEPFLHRIDYDDYELLLEVRTVTMGGVFYIPTSRRKNPQFSVSPFVKGGLHSWEMDIKESGFLLSTTEWVDEGVNLYLGTGVAFNFGSRFTLRVELEGYAIDDDSELLDGIGLFGVSSLFKF